MATTVEALKAIYVALGGSASDVKNITLIPDMLEKISVYAEAAAAELPAVTGSDNGKVLTVVTGKWKKANLPGYEMVNVTISGGSATLETGYDFAKIKGLIEAGTEVKLYDGDNNVYSLAYFAKTSQIAFSSVEVGAERVVARGIYINDNGTHTATTGNITYDA